MKKIETFTRHNCAAVSEATLTALKTTAAEIGLDVVVGGGKFNDNEFTPKLTFRTVTNGQTFDPAAENFTKYATLYKLKPEWLGQTFTANGESFKIVGLRMTRCKKPVLAEKNGAKYVFSTESIIAKFEK